MLNNKKDQTPDQHKIILEFCQQILKELHKGAADENTEKEAELMALHKLLNDEIFAENTNYGRLIVQAVKGLVSLPNMASVFVSLPLEGVTACLLYLLNSEDQENILLVQDAINKLVTRPLILSKVLKSLGTNALSVITTPKLKLW